MYHLIGIYMTPLELPNILLVEGIALALSNYICNEILAMSRIEITLRGQDNGNSATKGSARSTPYKV